MKVKTNTLKYEIHNIFRIFILLICSIFISTQTNGQEKEGAVLPFKEPASSSVTGKTLADSKHQWRKAEKHLPENAPNIVIFMTDDAGFANPSAFGGPVNMPTMKRLAESGISYNAFHTTAMCSPTRASLLTGRNHHRVATGQIAELSSDWDGYLGKIPKSTATLPQILSYYGYNTAAFGKWHNTPITDITKLGPFDRYPTGIGFDYFYGFLAGETSQYEPRLFENTNPIEPPHDANYHLTEDLAKKAIEWIQTSKTITPEKPFFLYFTPGAVHGPHQIFKEWADKYNGKFDEGWEALRAMTFEKQKEMGWIPKDAVLNPLAMGMQKWSDVPQSQREFQSRLMEIYAGFLEHTDVQYGKIVDELDRQGVLENTLIIYINSDNGPSAEGMNGTISELLAQNAMPSTIEQQIEVLNKDYGGMEALGGPKLDIMYHHGWAYAGASPFQGTKLVAAHLGGTRTPMVISWPKKIKHDGKVRSQFHHVNDIASTIYDILDITPPKVVNGVEQQPLDGTSMVYTFNNPETKTTKGAQYFEILGSRGVYHDGWFAGTFGPKKPWSTDPTGIINWEPEKEEWELYNLNEDYSQAENLADKNPEKLGELKAIFDKEATDNLVYPIGASFYTVFYSPSELPSSPLTEWSFYEGQERIPEAMAPKFVSGRSTVAIIDTEINNNTEGVLFALGGISSGFTVYIDKGFLKAEYNAMTLNRYKVASTTTIPTGKVKIEVETTYDTKERLAPATITLKVNGKEVGQGRIERSVPALHTASETFDIGVDLGSPVSLDYYDRVPFRFNGKIEKIYIKYIDE
ncbi:arylsulfatase [Tamlana fucoidanivorans]|uniref:Arylsulfatase n=1 Tax=Allotamlana fucoidanivorans TaxID=2583814 RepID=A0A5C4SEX6_9FLAO|nr:arylsulfatase [Tamlana fucoidanivorans]TNJ41247.1 arylsulfatase [Tamlana fucoidanivorans]